MLLFKQIHPVQNLFIVQYENNLRSKSFPWENWIRSEAASFGERNRYPFRRNRIVSLISFAPIAMSW